MYFVDKNDNNLNTYIDSFYRWKIKTHSKIVRLCVEQMLSILNRYVI